MPAWEKRQATQVPAAAGVQLARDPGAVEGSGVALVPHPICGTGWRTRS
jgi:hypothetical protein